MIYFVAAVFLANSSSLFKKKLKWQFLWRNQIFYMITADTMFQNVIKIMKPFKQKLNFLI